MGSILVAALLSFTAFGQSNPEWRSWNQPVTPFRIMGNLYYVGASDIASYLIVTSKGLIVLDGGFVETAPMIEKNIATLGLKVSDVRILLNSHAHFDHAGGLAELKQKSGAALYAGKGDVNLLARGGAGDPQMGDEGRFPSVVVDHAVSDGDRVTLGGTTVVAHATPGHTEGDTTWSTRVIDGGHTYDVVISGSASVPGNFRLAHVDGYPAIISDYRKAFATLRALPCDVFLAVHGGFFDLRGKSQRLAKGERPNPFIDPAGYQLYVSQTVEAFEKKLATGK